MGLVLTTINMKGGVGKTTLTINLATCLARDYQKRVLVLDLDSQISATLSVIPPHEFARLRKARRTLSYLIDKVIRPYISRKFSAEDMILESVCGISGLDLLPGDIELYDEYTVAETLAKQAEKEGKKFSDIWFHFEQVLIKNIIESVQERYDFILLDCAPGYNLLTRSGIVSSQFYLLPARPEPLSLVGIQLLERRIRKLKEQFNPPLNLNLLGIVFILSGGLFSGRYYGQVIQRIEQDFSSDKVFKNRIPLDVNVAKAVDTFTPAVVAMPNTAGSKAFNRLTQEFLDKIAAHSNSV
ncbi:ParA family protein [Spirulina subsalsa FACHB-351]|uniref:ParA family protein n=1 Tax=Spirulina subsalsa FACHB-351 TaxID=234711 RepID=A0ABT3L2H0_9CYAN|nr:ParA family protein [Spirulina subsalsa]MCW6035689.1 ParA family protein [Spirulina subsalsa FACHB-351]